MKRLLVGLVLALVLLGGLATVAEAGPRLNCEIYFKAGWFARYCAFLSRC